MFVVSRLVQRHTVDRRAVGRDVWVPKLESGVQKYFLLQYIRCNANLREATMIKNKSWLLKIYIIICFHYSYHF